jgi:hypothetical protein
MVAQGNLLPPSILFMDDFFFIFSQGLSFLFCFYSYSLKLRRSSSSTQQYLSFLGCEKGPIYDLSLLLCTIVETGVWEICFFKEFKLKDGIQRSKSWVNNSSARMLSSGFCTSIPIIQFHSIFKLLQIDFLMFVGRHTCFCITIELCQC